MANPIHWPPHVMLFLAVLYVHIPSLVHAVENPKLQLNELAPDFALKDSRGRYHAWTKFVGESGMVVAFLTVKALSEAKPLIELGPWLSDHKIGVLVIDATYKGDPTYLEQAYWNAGITYPVLYDSERLIAPLYHVTAVPAVFLLDNTLFARYVGAVKGEAGEPYLENAVRALVAGIPIAVPETNVRGVEVRPLPKPRPPTP